MEQPPPPHGRSSRARVPPPQQPSRGTCARRGAPTCRVGAPADSVCPLRRDSGGGVGASRRPGWGCAAGSPPGRTGPGSRERGRGGRRKWGRGGGGHTRSPLAGRLWGSPFGRDSSLLPGRPKSSRPASFLPAPRRPSLRSIRLRRHPCARFRTLASTSRAPPVAAGAAAQMCRGDMRGLTHTCCSRTPGQATNTNPHTGTLGHTRT